MDRAPAEPSCQAVPIAQAVLCLVAGMMLAVSVVELFPAAWKSPQRGG